MTEDCGEGSAERLGSDEGVVVYKEAGNDLWIGFFNGFSVGNDATPIYVTKREGIGLSTEMDEMGTPGNVVIYKRIPDVF